MERTPHRTPVIAAAWALALGTVAAPPAMAASSGLTLSLGCWTFFAGNTTSCADVHLSSLSTAPGTQLFSQDGVIDPTSGGVNSATNIGYASYGALGLGLQSFASSATGGNPPHAYARSDAYGQALFGDTMTIDAPGLTGSSGRMTVSVTLDGDLHAWDHSSDIGSAAREGFQADLDFRLNFWDASVGGLLAATSAAAGASVSAPGDAHDPSLPAVVTLEVPFVYGHAIYFENYLSIETGAYAEAPHLSPSDPAYAFGRSGGADASFMHTAAWGGLSAITDGSGHAVTTYTLTSASGVDWSQAYAAPVPEPATATLLLMGIGALAWRRRGGGRV